jgi:hypothetical protein
MSWPHDGRTPVKPNAPEEIGLCDRCYFRYPLSALTWQFEYRGNSLQNIWLRVCPRDLDIPQEQLRPVIIRGPESVVRNPRPYSYAANFAGGTSPPTSANPIDLDGSPLPGPTGTQIEDDVTDAPITDGGNILFDC